MNIIHINKRGCPFEAPSFRLTVIHENIFTTSESVSKVLERLSVFL